MYIFLVLQHSWKFCQGNLVSSVSVYVCMSVSTLIFVSMNGQLNLNISLRVTTECLLFKIIDVAFIACVCVYARIYMFQRYDKTFFIFRLSNNFEIYN